MKNNLTEKCKLAVDYGLTLGAEQIEAYASFSNLRKVSVKKQDIDEIHTVIDVGIGVRAYVNKGLGFSYSQNLDENSIKRTVKEAVDLSKIASPDPHFKTLPKSSKIKKIKNLFDKSLAQFSANSLCKKVQSLIDKLKRKEKDAVIFGSFEVDSGSYAVANSLGVVAEEPYSVIVGWLFIIVKDKNNPDETGSASDWIVSRSLRNFDWQFLFDSVLEKARKSLGAQKTNTRMTTLLLSPKASGELFESVANACCGCNVLYNRSFIKRYIGKQIAPKFLNVTIDFNTPGGAKSQSFDSEGCPTTTFYLIKNGKLDNLLLSSYSAYALKKKNNSCAMRYHYKSTPVEAPGNIKISPSNKKLNNIISKIEDGIFVDSFPQINPVNGIASSMIDYGIEIKDGKFTKPIKGTMIGFNAIEVLKNIDAISKESRKMAGYVLPYLRIRNVQISGS